MAVEFPPGYRLTALAETSSTNDACLEAARNGEAGGLWIMAKRQTAGRGSRGRPWQSQEGNLFASLLLDCDANPNRLSQLTFVTSIAVRSSIAELAGKEAAAKVTLKWPNDVLLNDCKVSGILLESHVLDGRQIVILGIGINCAGHPENVTFRATDLAENGIIVSPEAMLSLLARHVDTCLGVWQGGEGFEAIRREWLAFAKGLGKPVEIQLPGRRMNGIFEALDEAGHMILRRADGGREIISTADVFFTGDANPAGLVVHG